MKKCEVCEVNFWWDDDVVIVDDALYHKGCVQIYPTGCFAMLDGEPLGEVENGEGDCAYDILDDGEYEEDAE